MQSNNNQGIQRIQGKYKTTRNKQVNSNRTSTEHLWQMMWSSRAFIKKGYKEAEKDKH